MILSYTSIRITSFKKFSKAKSKGGRYEIVIQFFNSFLYLLIFKIYFFTFFYCRWLGWVYIGSLLLVVQVSFLNFLFMSLHMCFIFLLFIETFRSEFALELSRISMDLFHVLFQLVFLFESEWNWVFRI